MIRSATVQDAPRIAHIYNHYVEHTTISFEEEPLSLADAAQRIIASQSLSLPYLVLEHEQLVVGFAYAYRWKERSAYRFTVEASVYLDVEHVGQGHGLRLYSALLDALKAFGIHTVIGTIALPNPASVALHEKLGFKKVAHFAEIGFKFGHWHDTGCWHLSL